MTRGLHVGRRARASTPPPHVNTNGFVNRQRANMATLQRERVEHALNELLVRIVPEDPHDDEEAANQRFEDAFEFAINELTAAGDPALVPDVHHIASLMDRKGEFRTDWLS